MKIEFVFLLISFQTFISCSYITRGDLETIDLGSKQENPEEYAISSFVSGLDYIPLELTDSSIIINPKVVVSGDNIIIRNNGLNPPYLLLFDRRNGKFIRQIGSSGKGPDEYKRPIRDFFDFNSHLIYTTGYNNNEKTIDISGNVVSEFNLPKIPGTTWDGNLVNVQCDAYLSNGIFVGYVPNLFGNEKNKLILFSRDGVIRIYKNYLSFEKTTKTINIRKNKRFFRLRDELLFKEEFNDTVYQVMPDCLLPKYVFNLGSKGVKYELQDENCSVDKIKKYINILDIVPSEKFLFICFSYQSGIFLCVYDTRLMTTKVCLDNNSNTSALTDDINRFMPLLPVGFSQESELISILDPKDIVEWKEKNPEKLNEMCLKLPWLKDYSEVDNPVIVIAKCK